MALIPAPPPGPTKPTSLRMNSQKPTNVVSGMVLRHQVSEDLFLNSASRFLMPKCQTQRKVLGGLSAAAYIHMLNSVPQDPIVPRPDTPTFVQTLLPNLKLLIK